VAVSDLVGKAGQDDIVNLIFVPRSTQYREAREEPRYDSGSLELAAAMAGSADRRGLLWFNQRIQVEEL
jgi:hypothetical protein